MSIRRVARRSVTTLGVLAAGNVLLAGPASAHPADEAHLGGGLNGFLHPLLGYDHLAAMVAVGIIAALAYKRLPIWAMPTTFLGGMVAGGAFGFAGVVVGGVEMVITGSVIVFGLIIVAASRSPLGWWLLPAIALVGAAHGSAHGLEAPTAAAPVAYAIGFVLATALLHFGGAMVGMALRRFEVGQIVGGALVATFGITLVAGG